MSAAGGAASGQPEDAGGPGGPGGLGDLSADPHAVPRVGSLLASSATLADPNFARTLVLLLNVDEDGALGVVLNRPSEQPVAEVLAPWASLAGEPPVLFRGGPVEAGAALAVGLLRDDAAAVALGWQGLFGRVGLVDLDTPPTLLEGALASLRLYAGYAGWSAAQLAQEIAQGAWHVLPALPEDLFAAEPEATWASVLRRQGGEVAMLATLPLDPTHN